MYIIIKYERRQERDRKSSENVQILTFVKLGTNKWVVIASLLLFGNDCECCCCDGPAIVVFETLLELLFVSIASIVVDSKTGTSLKLCGFSMVNPDWKGKTIKIVVRLRLEAVNSRNSQNATRFVNLNGFLIENDGLCQIQTYLLL